MTKDSKYVDPDIISQIRNPKDKNVLSQARGRLLRYLMVTTHPPTHCGIGAYGEQEAGQLRAEGHIVDIASPDGQGNVDFAWDLRGGSKILKLLDLAPYYDRIVIQYHWAFFYNDVGVHYRNDMLKTTLSFLYIFLRLRKIHVVAHEIPYLNGKFRWLFGLQWRFPHLIFHTRAERDRLESHYGLHLKDSRVEVRQHHSVFQKFMDHTQSSARQALGIRDQQLVFLCIGFIQRHKGFDRGIQAFLDSGENDAQLYVVGSLRYVDADTQSYLKRLYELASLSSRVHIVESFVSDQEFDTWITASDWVVFPYTEIWSSGVLGRTRLLRRPAIIAAVGGLSDQAEEQDILFSTDEGLREAFHKVAVEASRGTNSTLRAGIRYG
jgi:glycosyltransferase involved in cell wall biosynthesis